MPDKAGTMHDKGFAMDDKAATMPDSGLPDLPAEMPRPRPSWPDGQPGEDPCGEHQSTRPWTLALLVLPIIKTTLSTRSMLEPLRLIFCYRV